MAKRKKPSGRPQERSKVRIRVNMEKVKGLPPEAKRELLEGMWLEWKRANLWQPTRALLAELPDGYAYSLVYEQKTKKLGWGVTSQEGIAAWEQETSMPLAEPVAQVRATGHIPVLVHYWADPADSDRDRDGLVLIAEEPEGIAKA